MACHTPEHWWTHWSCFLRQPYRGRLANIRQVQHALCFSRRKVDISPLWCHSGLLCTHCTPLVFVRLNNSTSGLPLFFFSFKTSRRIRQDARWQKAVNTRLITQFNWETLWGIFVWIRWVKNVPVWVFALWCLPSNDPALWDACDPDPELSVRVRSSRLLMTDTELSKQAHAL